MTKVSLLSLCLWLAFSVSASADGCRDDFAKLLTDRPDQSPVKIHITQEIQGGMTMKNYNYQANSGHWMTEMITPAQMQWTLVHDDKMYTSSDKGKSWKKLRDLNSAQNNSASNQGLLEAAETIKNASCGQEDLDGVPHKTLEADYDYPKLKTKHHEKFWVNVKSGWIAKSVMQTTTGSFSSTTTQIIEPAPELKLPTP